MSNLPRRLGDAVDNIAGREASIGRRSVPARIERAVERSVAVEHGRAIVQAARVRGLEYVAHEALRGTGQLAQEEAFWMQHVPAHARWRLQAIADGAAIRAADLVDEMGRF